MDPAQHGRLGSSGGPGRTSKPVSKLQRRIQAGHLQAHAAGTARVSGPSGGEPSPPEAEPSRSLVRQFGFPAPPQTLFAPPSAFAAALPTPAAPVRRSPLRLISFPQPVRPGAFVEPSPDDQVLLARHGTSLGIHSRPA